MIRTPRPAPARRAIRPRSAAVLLVLAASLAACSSDDSSTEATSSTSSEASTPTEPTDSTSSEATGSTTATEPTDTTESATTTEAATTTTAAPLGDPEGTDPLPALPDEVALPIVFVHGFAGSAQQYESQAMRFVANGYPQERIRL